MNNKILHIDICSVEESLQNFVQVWNTEKSSSYIDRLTFESMSIFLKSLNIKRWDLLTKLKKDGKQTTEQLAIKLNRNNKTVLSDVKELKELGLIKKDSRNLIYVPWDEIETRMRLAA